MELIHDERLASQTVSSDRNRLINLTLCQYCQNTKCISKPDIISESKTNTVPFSNANVTKCKCGGGVEKTHEAMTVAYGKDHVYYQIINVQFILYMS